MTIIVKADDSTHEEWLKSKATIVEKLMLKLSEIYKFKRPEKIIFRPTLYRSRKMGILLGRAGRYRGIYFIALMPIIASDETIAHEVAHVAELLKYNTCGHGGKWNMMYNKAIEILKGDDTHSD